MLCRLVPDQKQPTIQHKECGTSTGWIKNKGGGLLACPLQASLSARVILKNEMSAWSMGRMIHLYN